LLKSLKPIETMEWMSLFLVVGSGAATLLTLGSRLVMIKPSLTYIIVGIVMLQPEWMKHYLPNLAKAVAPDIAVILGYACAAQCSRRLEFRCGVLV
jgi:intracellular septation protein